MRKEKYTVLILDDLLESMGHIETTLTKLPHLEVQTESDIRRARSIVDQGVVDILVLDLHMPEADGFTFIGLLEHNPAVIMCSGYEISGTEAFDHGVVDCIKKMSPRKRVLEAVEKAIKQLYAREREKESAKTVITLRRVYNNILEEINWKEIQCVSITDNVLSIFDMESEQADYYCTLAGFLDKVPLQEFVQTHRCYAVRIDAIRNREGKKLILTKWLKVPIGDTYFNEVERVIGDLKSRMKSKECKL